MAQTTDLAVALQKEITTAIRVLLLARELTNEMSAAHGTPAVRRVVAARRGNVRKRAKEEDREVIPTRVGTCTIKAPR
jgi:hypothetical protein